MAALEIVPVIEWLMTQALAAIPFTALVDGCAERMLAAGLPLMRMHVAATTLHPLYSAVGHTWRRGGGATSAAYLHGKDDSPAFQQSPLKYLLENEQDWMRFRVEIGEGTNRFPALGEFKAMGGTDYFAYKTAFGSDGAFTQVRANGCIISWLTDRPGGFSAADLEAIERLRPVLCLALRVASDVERGRIIVGTYLGRDAGARVLDGRIQRGMVERLDAAIFYADLRGFTDLADRMPAESVTALLNDYFDAIIAPIDGHGGHVLKFMGDALLATFARDEDIGAAARAALSAAEGAQGAVAAVNESLLGEGRPTMTLDLGLHLGEVMYGNVGSASRLDFTVIGPAVNEASRMEALCKTLGCSVLASSTFVDAVADASRFRPLGTHQLRGVREPRALYTLAAL